MSDEVNIKKLSNEHLKIRLEKLVSSERKLTRVILEHIGEVSRREVYFEWGFESLHAYLTQGIGYSEGAAYRRMKAAQAIRQLPSLQSEIEEGTINLSQITMVQSAISHQEKHQGQFLSLEAKAEIFESIKHKNKHQTQKVLDEYLGESKTSTQESEVHKRDDSVELTLRLPAEVYEKLMKIKNFYSHIQPGASWVELINSMADDAIEKRDPALKGKRNIPAYARRIVFQRAKGKCEFVNSQHQLEIDHIMSKFAGGKDEIENLRVLCRAHNQYRYRAGK